MKRRPLQIGDRVRVRGSKDKGTVKNTYPSDMQVIVAFSGSSLVGVYHPEQLIRLVPKKPVPLREIWVNFYQVRNYRQCCLTEEEANTLADENSAACERAVHFIEARRAKK